MSVCSYHRGVRWYLTYRAKAYTDSNACYWFQHWNLLGEGSKAPAQGSPPSKSWVGEIGLRKAPAQRLQFIMIQGNVTVQVIKFITWLFTHGHPGEGTWLTVPVPERASDLQCKGGLSSPRAGGRNADRRKVPQHSTSVPGYLWGLAAAIISDAHLLVSDNWIQQGSGSASLAPVWLHWRCWAALLLPSCTPGELLAHTCSAAPGLAGGAHLDVGAEQQKGSLEQDFPAAGRAGRAVPVPRRMWTEGESEGLQTLGIVVVVCSSLKLLHYLGLIDLSDDKIEDELEMTTVCHRPEGLEQLEAQTNFTKRELQVLYRGFKNECPSGVVNEETFKQIYAQFFPHGDASMYAHYLFNAFDTAHNGSVKFEDFVMALSILLRGTVHEKLRWTFNLYDINKDGYINKEEMMDIVKAIYDMMGKYTYPVLKEDAPRQHVEVFFQKMDKNKDGVVTLDEFIESCQEDDNIMRSLQLFENVM
ncbi:hypothetical protein IHE44_0003671 [Lamprotornis superbus]|uniref:EF-hand domain-containing protein n=1 Tax=Lamprotornis superbus TaxID=245042 RepID=A0A835TP86_9PASS|nr:hypothetical protein IHE44_0003671 [Lamprotornis superbus]